QFRATLSIMLPYPPLLSHRSPMLPVDFGVVRHFDCLIAMLLAAAALMGSPAWAEDFNSGNYLMPGCRKYVMGNYTSYIEAFMSGMCAGTVETLMTFSRVLDFCLPPGVTADQGMRVVVQYIDSHPERLQEYFKQLATDALKNAWPCHQ